MSLNPPYSVLAGNVVRFSVVFRDDSGALEDPSSVSCRVGLEGTEGTSLDVVRDSTGTYHADWDTTGKAAGSYWVLAAGTGDLIAAREVRVTLRAPHLATA